MPVPRPPRRLRWRPGRPDWHAVLTLRHPRRAQLRTRVLGPAGKMPNPKVGTVTMDLTKAVQESKSGKVEYRTDRTAIVHLVIGKASFQDMQLLENYATVIEELIRAKPAAAKGRYLRTITLASTMGPGVKVDPNRTRDIIEEAPPASVAA